MSDEHLCWALVSSFLKHNLSRYSDDLASLHRICLEYCEDAQREGILYSEPRYSPHLFLSGKSRDLKPEHVVEAINQAMQEGQERYGVQVTLPVQRTCVIQNLDDQYVRLYLGEDNLVLHPQPTAGQQ